MKEKEKKDKVERKTSSIVIGILLILFSVLLFLSIVGRSDVINEDLLRLASAEYSFSDIITLNFPVVNNIVGPFGVFFGFSLVYLTGYIWSYFIILSMFLLGIYFSFLRGKQTLLIRSLSFIFIGLFVSLTLISLYPTIPIQNGRIIEVIYGALNRTFNRTGTAIIALTLAISFLFVLFGLNAMAAFGKSILNMFKRMGNGLLSWMKNSNLNKESKSAPFIDVAEEDTSSKKMIKPKITDHVDYGSNHSEMPIGSSIDDGEGLINKPAANKTVPTPSKSAKQKNVIGSEDYQKPKVEDFLTSTAKISYRDRGDIEAYINSTSKILIEKLAQFGIEAEVVNVNVGPIITQYELKPAPNIKVSRFQSLADDLALAIKARSIRVQAPIPGRGLIGIEVPNKYRDTIYLKDVLLSDQMEKSSGKLTIALGKDIVGTPVVADLSRMPHLLIAGSTNSGKSVCINSIICNLLFNNTPDELRLVLIDPKRVELSGYEDIPHLIQEIVSGSEQALTVLNWAVSEMERRYELLQECNVRDISSYNKKIKEQAKGSKELGEDTLPTIVIIIDEFADLMMSSGRDIEMPITRLAQMARAIGIHLILATQRPSIKIITGLIKANFPARIAFQVAQKIDSRVILDMNGAETLLGMGDMLFISPSKATPERIHGAYVSDQEIENLVSYLRTQPKPEQKIEIIDTSDESIETLEYDDELFIDAAKLVISADTASVSMLQRHFKIGYARAGRLIDMLEKAKIIGKYVGSKSRDVIATPEVISAYNLNK